MPCLYRTWAPMATYGHYVFDMNNIFWRRISAGEKQGLRTTSQAKRKICILFVITALLNNKYYLLTSFAFHSDRLKGYEERNIRSVHALLDASVFPHHTLLGRLDHSQLRRWNKLKIYWLYIYSEWTKLKTKPAKTGSIVQIPW